MKIPREYGGLGLTMSAYGKALMLAGSAHPSLGALLSAHQSIGVPEPVKLVGTAEQKASVPPPLRRGRRLGLPADRARRRVRPGPDGHHGHPHRGRHGIPPRRREAVDHQRRRRRAARRHGAGARARGRPRRHHRVRRRGHSPRGSRSSGATRFMGLQGHRERPDPVPPGAGARREPAGPRGRRPQDRAHHPQRRAAVHPGDVRGGRQVGAEDRPRVVGRAGAVGPAGRRARGRRREDRLHRRHDLRPGVGAGAVGAARRRRAARTSGSRRRWPSCGRARWPGRSPTSSSRSVAGEGTRPPSPCAPAASEPCPPSRCCATCGSTGSSRGRPRSCTCSSPGRPSTPTSRRPARSPTKDADLQDKARAAAGASGFYAKWLPQLVVGKGAAPIVVRRVRAPGAAPAVRGAGSAQAGAADVLRDVALAGEAGVPAGVPRPGRRHRRRAVRHGGGVQPGRDAARRRRRARAPRPTSSPTRSAARAGCGSRRCSTPCGPTPTTPTGGWPSASLAGDYTWLEEGVLDPSEGTGPWIAPWSPGPSESGSVWRSYR